MNYEEKLRLAKEALASGSYDKETIEYIFPELKESEDERIRQNLHKLLCAEISIGTFEKYGLTDDSVFDWFEKQKPVEQNPISWCEEDEKNIEMINSAIDFASNQNLPRRIINDGDKYILKDWFKSIKPNHWKPSKEQLTALKNVIIGKRGPLYDLYFDLENL